MELDACKKVKLSEGQLDMRGCVAILIDDF